MSTSGERILVVQSDRGQLARLQRGLKPSQAAVLAASSVAEALAYLSREEIHLLIVLARPVPSPSGTGPGGPDEKIAESSPLDRRRTLDAYECCRALKSDPRGARIPLLLIVCAILGCEFVWRFRVLPVWADDRRHLQVVANKCHHVVFHRTSPRK